MMRVKRLDDRQRRLRAKNLALFGVLLALVVLFYIITLVRVGSWQ